MMYSKIRTILIYNYKEVLIMGYFTGKTVIITGAGRATLSDGRCGSIGYGIATAYAKEGANIVITGRSCQTDRHQMRS